MENNQQEMEKEFQETPQKKYQPSLAWLKRLRWKYLLWAFYFFVGFVAFVLLFDKVIMPLYTKHGQEIIMPDVTGLPLEEAQKKLESKGFRPIIDKEVYSNQYPAGVVISQNPMPESVVKTGRRTYLTVSKGAKWVQVPRLIGGSERDAELKLRQKNLIPGEKSYEFSSFYPKGVVIAQSVPVGDSVTVGDTVNFVVSLGEIPENLKVPNLVGKSLKEARETLVKLGLRVGMVTYQVNNDLLPETVIQQSVPPDSVVDVGTPIDLVVSTIEKNQEENTQEDDTGIHRPFDSDGRFRPS